MRQTTKITIGVLTAFILLSIGYIFYLSTLPSEDYTGKKIAQTFSHTSLEPYHVVIFEMATAGVQEVPQALYGNLSFKSGATEGYQMECPKDVLKYMTYRSVNDTLRITVDGSRLNKDYQLYKAKGMYLLTGFNLSFSTDSTLQIINRIQTTGLTLKQQQYQRLAIESNKVSIDSCRIGDLAISSGCSSFAATNSVIPTLNIDLDRIGSWTIKDCRIETENLTGGSSHYVDLTKEECQRMNWIPKNEKAELSVRLKGGSPATLTFN